MYHKSLSTTPQTHTVDAEMLIEESKLGSSVEKFRCQSCIHFLIIVRLMHDAIIVDGPSNLYI